MTAQPALHPFSGEQWRQVNALLETLDTRQALWLSGYLAAQGNPLPVAEPTSNKSLVIAWGTETGNSKRLALELAARCRDAGLAIETKDLADLRPRQLAKFENLAVIVATHGDGEPPVPIQPLYDALMAESAPRLERLSFAILALGDSSFEHYCVTGKQLDQRLEQLGGQRLLPRQDCDVDFEAPARDWIGRFVDTVAASSPAPAIGATPMIDPAAIAIATATATAIEYSKDRPLSVEVLSNQRFSAADRRDAIHHLELALDADDFPCRPGDAVGIFPLNPPVLVTAVLTAGGLTGAEPVIVDGHTMPLLQALREQRDLTIPGARFLAVWAELTGSEPLAALSQAEVKAQRAFLREQQVRPLMERHPARPDAQILVDCLRPLQPRLYDVANSLSTVGDELHLTVQADEYRQGDHTEQGIASQFLCALNPGDRVRLYPHGNARFHLPDDPDSPLILIADGTGIAPYRAFLQALAERDRPPQCWLVFGEQDFEEDFLYQTDIQQFKTAGVLHTVDCVFYRQASTRAHSQAWTRSLASPLLDQSDGFINWIARGAHVFFCGNKDRLSNCEAILSALVDDELGAGHWKRLNKDKRIHRNVY